MAQSSNVEAQYLLPLLLEEKKLVTEVGPQHPALLSLQERIREVRNYLDRHPESQVVSAPPPPLTPVPENSNWSAAAPLPPIKQTSEAPVAPPAPVTAPKAVAAPRPVPAGGAEESSLEPGEIRIVPEKPPVASTTTPTFPEQPERAPDFDSSNVGAEKNQAAASPPLFLTISLNQSLLVACVLLGVLLIHLVGLAIVLRLFGKRVARWALAELAALPVQHAMPPAVAVSGPAAEPSTATEPAEARGHVERFDGGPAYEEEIRQRLQLESQRQKGLLRHIFEDNLRLHAQLEQLPVEAG